VPADDKDDKDVTAATPQEGTEAAPKPVAAVPGAKGKKKKKKKEKLPKLTPVNITRGTLTVDGWIGKAALNYDVPDLKFLYFYAPGIGTAVVSSDHFLGAKEQFNAFNGKTLTIKVAGDHVIQLYSDKLLIGKKPESAWVLLDPSFMYPSKFPAMGYGTVFKAPYVWPGSKLNPAWKGDVKPPPIPKDLLPVLAATCVPLTPGQQPGQPPAQPAGLPSSDPPAATPPAAAEGTTAGQATTASGQPVPKPLPLCKPGTNAPAAAATAPAEAAPAPAEAPAAPAEAPAAPAEAPAAPAETSAAPPATPPQ
jgi:hypothetical protein